MNDTGTTSQALVRSAADLAHRLAVADQAAFGYYMRVEDLRPRIRERLAARSYVAADEESQLRGSIVSSIASSHLVIEAWKKNRVIYCLDQELTKQLTDTDQRP